MRPLFQFHLFCSVPTSRGTNYLELVWDISSSRKVFSAGWAVGSLIELRFVCNQLRQRAPGVYAIIGELAAARQSVVYLFCFCFELQEEGGGAALLRQFCFRAVQAGGRKYQSYAAVLVKSSKVRMMANYYFGRFARKNG